MSGPKNFVLNKMKEKERQRHPWCRGALTAPVLGPGQKRALVKSRALVLRECKMAAGETARYKELHTSAQVFGKPLNCSKN